MEVAAQLLSPATLQRKLETDGPLDGQYRRAEFVEVMHREVWGQGFAPPVFSEEVDVVSQRLVGEKHLALKLKHQGQAVDGIWFGRIEPLPARVKLAYRLDVDEWQGQKRVRFWWKPLKFSQPSKAASNASSLQSFQDSRRHQAFYLPPQCGDFAHQGAADVLHRCTGVQKDGVHFRC